jgi:hypothetical protein
VPPFGSAVPADFLCRVAMRHGSCAASLLLVTMGTIGVLYGGNLVWINRLEHPFILRCIAATAAGAGLVTLILWRWLRLLIGLASAFMVMGWFVMGVLWFLLGGVSWQVAGADAPGDSEYEPVVREQYDAIDMLWTVYVRQTPGLFSRDGGQAASAATQLETGPSNTSTGEAPGTCWCSRPTRASLSR